MKTWPNFAQVKPANEMIEICTSLTHGPIRYEALCCHDKRINISDVGHGLEKRSVDGRLNCDDLSVFGTNGAAC